MASTKNVTDPLLNLNRIPKTKQAIDYVREKLAAHKSEEAISFINKILELYYTSPGFNALQLSKVRIKRMKAAHYKEMLMALDEELKTILASSEFGGEQLQQLSTAKENENSILDKTIQLTSDLAVHPTYSMLDEAAELEAALLKHHEPELVLHLFNKSRLFYKQSIPSDKFTDFLKTYEQAFEHTKNNFTRVKLGYALHAMNNTLHPFEEIEDLFKKFEQALLIENIEEHKIELLVNILKCGSLLPNATTLLKTYIAAAEELIQNNEGLQDNEKGILSFYIAIFSTTASRPYRIKLLNEYECISNDTDSPKLKSKIAKGIVYLNFDDITEAEKQFNAAEHLIFKTSWKNADRRNSWKGISYWRKFVFAERLLEKNSMYSTLMFDDLEKIVRDSVSENEKATFSLYEIEALKDFFNLRWKDAIQKYKAANQFYKAPYYPIDYYFNQAMIAIMNEKNEVKFIDHLKKSERIYFSTKAIEVLERAKKYYQENKSSDVYEINNPTESNLYQ